MDDIIFTTNRDVNSDLLLQHYNHAVEWNPGYSAKDLILKPADGGYVNMQYSPTKYYAPVSAEKSWGTFHRLESSNRPSGYVYAATPSASSNITIDISSYVPPGSLGVMFTAFTNATNSIVVVNDAESRSSASYQNRLALWGSATTQYNGTTLHAPLSSNRKFTLYSQNASALWVAIEGYYL